MKSKHKRQTTKHRGNLEGHWTDVCTRIGNYDAFYCIVTLMTVSARLPWHSSVDSIRMASPTAMRSSVSRYSAWSGEKGRYVRDIVSETVGTASQNFIRALDLRREPRCLMSYQSHIFSNRNLSSLPHKEAEDSIAWRLDIRLHSQGTFQNKPC